MKDAVFSLRDKKGKENGLIRFSQLPYELVFVEFLLSLRTSAHTGVAIPRLKGTR